MHRSCFAIAVFILLALPVLARAQDFSGHLVTPDQPTAMPDFIFQDASGQSLRLEDFRGHPLILNLWATWCGPCVREMPSLDALQAMLAADGVQIIALDEERNSVTLAESFFKRHEIKNLKLYADPGGRASSALHLQGLPTSILIDSQGRSVGIIEGGVNWMSPSMIAAVRQHLLGNKDVGAPDNL